MKEHALSPPVLLVIEDSDEDYATFQRALSLTRLQASIHRCRDGDEALEFLFERTPEEFRRLRPSLIMLDLNLPGIDGRDILAFIKGDNRLRDIPLIILTSSQDPKDISDCYWRGANGYQLKCTDYDGFKKEMQRTVDYWFNTAIIPEAAAPGS